jgi:hypothetical protein
MLSGGLGVAAVCRSFTSGTAWQVLLGACNVVLLGATHTWCFLGDHRWPVTGSSGRTLTSCTVAYCTEWCCLVICLQHCHLSALDRHSLLDVCQRVRVCSDVPRCCSCMRCLCMRLLQPGAPPPPPARRPLTAVMRGPVRRSVCSLCVAVRLFSVRCSASCWRCGCMPCCEVDLKIEVPALDGWHLPLTQ